MAFMTEVLSGDYAERAARRITEAFTGGSFVLTGGTTAEAIYPRLAGKRDWSQATFCFSDERCVPPDDAESNYGMVKRMFFDAADAGSVHRVKGELDPQEAAAEYAAEIRPLAERGFDLLLLGMGADAHIGAMFPGSPALDETGALAAAVDRPDGMKGVTLTPPAMLSARRIILVVTGEGKATTVRRAVTGDEDPKECPVRLLAEHPDATFLLDEAAASAL